MKQLRHEREKITQDLDLIEQELAEREGLREDNAESLDNKQERIVPLRFYKGEEESVDNIMVEMMNEMNNNSAMAKNDSETSREENQEPIVKKVSSRRRKLKEDKK